MNKFVRISTTCLVILLGLATSAFAQATGQSSVIAAGAAFGVGLTVIGAAYGIGRLAGSALESMARQPEVADKVVTNMITIAALLEGAGIIALVFCLLGLFL